MPGVPKARGCNACRKAKKGCDQAKPACSRCLRIGIECTGAGLKRYKFIPQETSDTVAPGRRVAVAKVAVQIPPKVPANRDALIAGNICSRLSITDLRYDITCFGNFLSEIPQRIGTNRALDMTADAFAAASVNLQTPNSNTTQALVKHGRALRALRDCLSDPAQSTSPETICAIYMTTITEVLLQDMPGSHAGAVAYLLEKGVYRAWTSHFDLSILATLYFYVLLETVGNRALQLGPWVSDVLDKLEPLHPIGPARCGAATFSSFSLRGLTRMCIAIRDPVANYADLLLIYKQSSEDRVKIHQYFDMLFPSDQSGSPSPPDSPGPFFREFITQVSMATTVCLLVNRILQEITPETPSLVDSHGELLDDVINLTERSLPYKPLGATHALSGLGVAWAATRDQSQRDTIYGLMKKLDGCGFPTSSRLKEAHWWELKFAQVGSQARRLWDSYGVDEDYAEEKMVPEANDCHVQ